MLTIEITIQMQEFLTECLPLRDGDNFTTLAGSAVLVEVCGLRVILQCFNLVFNQLGRTGQQPSSRRKRFRIDTRSVAFGSSSSFGPLSRRRLNPIKPVYDPDRPDGRFNLTASAFNQLGQYTSSPGRRGSHPSQY